jgi:putative hydrolase of the HAD superfamily
MSSAHSKRPIKAIIFDLDNTLTDFMSAKANAVRAAADAMIDAGLKLDAEDVYARIFKIYDAVGIEHQRVFDKLLIDVLGHVDDRIMAAGVVAYRRAREAFLVPYPHVQYTLNRLLKEGYKLAVVSDAPRFEAWLRLCYLRLHHIFDVVLTYDDTKMRKPSPVPFRLALDELGVEPCEAVMIGDWPERDIVGGAGAGLHTVYARYGDTYDSSDRKVQKDSGALFDIDDLAQLFDVLDSLNADPEGGPPCA